MNTQTIATIAQRADAVARADWAPYVECAVRRAVAVCVAVYVAGVMIGAAVHALNDWLAPRFARVVLACDIAGRGAVAPAPYSPRAIEAAPTATTPAAPTVHPLAMIRDDLLALSAKELRHLAGIASKRYTKAAMVDMILCMA